MKKILFTLTIVLCTIFFTQQTFAQLPEVPDTPELSEIFADPQMRQALLDATIYKDEPSFFAPRLYRTVTVNLIDGTVKNGPWNPNREIVQAWVDFKNSDPNLVCGMKDSIVMTDIQLVQKVLSYMIAKEQKNDGLLNAQEQIISFSRDTFWTKIVWLPLRDDVNLQLEKTGWVGKSNIWYRACLLQLTAEWSLSEKTASIQAVDNTHKFIFKIIEGNLVLETEVFLPPMYREVFVSALNVLAQQE